MTATSTTVPPRTPPFWLDALVTEYAGHIAIVIGDTVTLRPDRQSAARFLAEVLR